MFRILFSLIPWWLFAIFAAISAPLTLEFFEDYQWGQDSLARAVLAGPPDVIPVDQLGRNDLNAPFGEVQLDGTLRADLGVQNIYFAETEYTFVVLDGTSTGPLVALIFPETEAEQGLTSLVNDADGAGRVTVRAFLAPTRAGEISRQLARANGITRQVFVVEPYFEPRNDVLAARVGEIKGLFFVSLAITSVFGLMAVWRFRQWRKRRSPATQSQTSARDVAAQKQASSPPKSPTKKPLPSSNGASPWGTFKPIDQNVPSQSKTGMVKSQSLQAQVGARGTPLANQSPKPLAADTPPPEPEFTSVFPGGGSAFRFKSSDQIIRQSFGTLSTLTKTPRKDG